MEGATRMGGRNKNGRAQQEWEGAARAKGRGKQRPDIPISFWLFLALSFLKERVDEERGRVRFIRVWLRKLGLPLSRRGLQPNGQILRRKCSRKSGSS